MAQKTFWRALLLASSTLLLNAILTYAEPDVQRTKRQVGPAQFNFHDCYVRWNVIRPGQTWQDAQVRTPVWTTTPADFTRTINNMANNGDTPNAMLWLHSYYALAYAGVANCGMRITPQAGLNGPNVVGSLILPSGVAKLNRVAPEPGSIPVANLGAAQQIIAIANQSPNNPLTPDDYAYFKNGPYSDGTGGLLAAMAAWRTQYNIDRQTKRPEDRVDQASFAAVTGSGRTVEIVIDGLAVMHS